MLDQVRKFFSVRAARVALLMVAAGAIPSCATKQEPQLVSTGAERESTLPWNKQEKWESQGQFGELAEQQSRH